MQHIPGIRIPTVFGFVLAGVHGSQGALHLADAHYLSLLFFLASLLCLLATVKMVRDNCFESRFGLVTIALTTLVGHTLSLTAGLPGSAASAWAGGHLVLGAISVLASVALLALLLPHLFQRQESVIGPRV